MVQLLLYQRGAEGATLKALQTWACPAGNTAVGGSSPGVGQHAITVWAALGVNKQPHPLAFSSRALRLNETTIEALLLRLFRRRTWRAEERPALLRMLCILRETRATPQAKAVQLTPAQTLAAQYRQKAIGVTKMFLVPYPFPVRRSPIPPFNQSEQSRTLYRVQNKVQRPKRPPAMDDLILISALLSMVRMTGLEPALPFENQILSLARLPISPHPLVWCSEK